jgi:hypothetical protein
LNRFGSFFCVVVASLAIAGPLAAAPRIKFTPTGVVAEGIRPGGDAIWFVHSVTEFSGWPRLSRIARVVTDEDRDGSVSLEGSVTPSSVWAVVDYATGESAIAMPEGAPPVRELRERGNGWAAGRAHLDFAVSDLDVLLVRPGRGAWVVRTQQGGSRDGDGRPDNNLRVRLSDMEKLHGSDKTPPVALPRDLVIAVHPTKLLTFVRSAAEGQP